MSLLDFDMPHDFSLSEECREQIEISGHVFSGQGLVANHIESQTVIWGSSVEVGGRSTAYYELLERAAVLRYLIEDSASVPIEIDATAKPLGFADARRALPSTQPQVHPTQKLSHSNGVALGESLSNASSRALNEAVERHVILHAWRAQLAPIPLALSAEQSLAVPQYDTEHYYVQCPRGYVTITMLAPHRRTDPLILGYGMSKTLEASIQKSCNEALQRLVFLFGEPLPTDVPESPNAGFHQDFYLVPENHQYLFNWLQAETKVAWLDLPALEDTRYYWLNANFDDPYPVVRASHPKLECLYLGPQNGQIPHPIA